MSETRWGAYVEKRLGELERGEGDFTGLSVPSPAAVERARAVAASMFRCDTPTPSVVPGEDGEVLFVWRKNGLDAEIEVTAERAELWAHHRETGATWSGDLADHAGCCLQRMLDAVADTPTALAPSAGTTPEDISAPG